MTYVYEELEARTPGSAEKLRESGRVLAQEMVDTVIMGHPRLHTGGEGLQGN